jgi:hypothetical protein
MSKIKDLDIGLIPSVIYNETINFQTKKIQDYFFKNKKLLYSFADFNSRLKQANYLYNYKKIGCSYNIPWKTYSNYSMITFLQQVREYKYMLLYWLPFSDKSYIQYLSHIALKMIKIINKTIRL